MDKGAVVKGLETLTGASPSVETGLALSLRRMMVAAAYLDDVGGYVPMTCENVGTGWSSAGDVSVWAAPV